MLSVRLLKMFSVLSDDQSQKKYSQYRQDHTRILINDYVNYDMGESHKWGIIKLKII